MTRPATAAVTALDGSPERVWTWQKGIRASLTHYAAAGRHEMHWHDHLQVSFVLAGALREALEGREYASRGLWRGHKPAGARHVDLWGPNGVLVFTLKLDEQLAAEWGLAAEPGWAEAEEPQQVRALVRLFAEEADGERRTEAALDLLAAAREQPRPPGQPPLWLSRIRDSIEDSPASLSVAAAARQAGVHRCQLSRLFRRHYGVPPSVYRRRVLVARATQALAQSDSPLALVAAEAGFYDQAHLSNALRSETGLSPSQVRRLLDRRHSSKN